MQVLFVDNEEDRAMLVTDKLGSRDCEVTRAQGVIEAAGLIGLKRFDLVLISELDKIAPVSSFLNRLRASRIPYAYLIPKKSYSIPSDGRPAVTVEELDNGALSNLIGAIA